MKTVEHVFKSFTVIDFLGIFTPGLITVLAFNLYFGGVAAPCTALFGEQSVILLPYVVLLSYLVGILLHELSKPLEWLLTLGIDLNSGWQENPAVIRRYRDCFQTNLARPAARRNKAARRAWRNIYYYMQPAQEQTNVLLLHAFASMARTCCVAAVAVACMNAWACRLDLPAAQPGPFVPALCLVVLGVMAFRCRRFHKSIREHIYTAFLREERPVPTGQV